MLVVPRCADLVIVIVFLALHQLISTQTRQRVPRPLQVAFGTGTMRTDPDHREALLRDRRGQTGSPALWLHGQWRGPLALESVVIDELSVVPIVVALLAEAALG